MVPNRLFWVNSDSISFEFGTKSVPGIYFRVVGRFWTVFWVAYPWSSMIPLTRTLGDPAAPLFEGHDVFRPQFLYKIQLELESWFSRGFWAPLCVELWAGCPGVVCVRYFGVWKSLKRNVRFDSVWNTFSQNHSRNILRTHYRDVLHSRNVSQLFSYSSYNC